MANMKNIEIQGKKISLLNNNSEDFICLTDVALNFCYWFNTVFQNYLIK